MKATLCILAALVLTAYAQKVGDDCMTAADCTDGCCVMMGDTMKCHMKAMKGEKCDLTGMSKDVCMCQDDMMCIPEDPMNMKTGKCMELIV